MVTRQDLGLRLTEGSNCEKVLNIIQTAPGGKAKRFFFLTQYRIFSLDYVVNDARTKLVLMGGEKQIKFNLQDKLVDFVYHYQQQVEYIFAIDELNVYTIDPLAHTAVNTLTMDARSTCLKCMVGRYSQSKKRFLLFIGDNRGRLNVFDPQEMEIIGEVQLFPDITTDPKLNFMSTFKKKPVRTQALEKFLLLEDQNQTPYIVASRGFKKKIAIFHISSNSVSHFAFPEKVLGL